MELSIEIKEFLARTIERQDYKGHELQLAKIAKKLNLELFAAKFTDPKLSGIIYKDENTNKFKIYTNETHPITRQRFTTAHEIGHYISAKCGSYSNAQLFKSEEGFEDYGVSFRKDGYISEAETEANEIAAEMLMPTEEVKKFLEEGVSIEQMANKFYVSPVAMTIRVERLVYKNGTYML